MNCFGLCLGKTYKNQVSLDNINSDFNKQRLRPKISLSANETSHKVLRKVTLQSQNFLKKENKDSFNMNVKEKFLNILNTSQNLCKNNNLRKNPEKITQDGINNTSNKFKPLWEFKDKLRGAKCKHENWQLKRNPAIIGLNSDYITEDIIGSQRPSTTLIKEYNLIKIFKNEKIGLIVNLQREGEHPFCGPNKKLEPTSGFTYDPQIFILEDIKVKLSGWKDMSVPDSINFILDTIKEMAITIKLNKKKVLVHCHAGYGRTGVVIACYQIFDTLLDVEDILQIIRKKRPESIKKNSQVLFCKNFKEYITRAKIIFNNHKISIENFMKNQNDILYGDEFNKYEHIPKIFSEILDKIINNKNSNKSSKEEIYKKMFYLDKWNENQEDFLKRTKNELNKNIWFEFYKISDIDILSKLISHWLEDCIEFIINPEKIELIFEEQRLGVLISKHLEESENFSNENRKELTDKIKKSLRTIEFETLICLANFANELKPENTSENDLINKYYNMLRKLSIQILGFPSKIIFNDSERFKNNSKFPNDILNIKNNSFNKYKSSSSQIEENNHYNNLDNCENILYYGDCVIDLIEFFGLIIRSDLNHEKQDTKIINNFKIKVISRYSTSKKTNTVNVEKNNFTAISRDAQNLEDSNDKLKRIKYLEDKNNDIGLIELKPCILEESFEDNYLNMIKEKDSKKILTDNYENYILNPKSDQNEAFFKEVYKMLHFYFNSQTNSIDYDKGENLKLNKNNNNVFIENTLCSGEDGNLTNKEDIKNLINSNNFSKESLEFLGINSYNDNNFNVENKSFIEFIKMVEYFVKNKNPENNETRNFNENKNEIKDLNNKNTNLIKINPSNFFNGENENKTNFCFESQINFNNQINKNNKYFENNFSNNSVNSEKTFKDLSNSKLIKIIDIKSDFENNNMDLFLNKNSDLSNIDNKENAKYKLTNNEKDDNKKIKFSKENNNNLINSEEKIKFKSIVEKKEFRFNEKNNFDFKKSQQKSLDIIYGSDKKENLPILSMLENKISEFRKIIVNKPNLDNKRIYDLTKNNIIPRKFNTVKNIKIFEIPESLGSNIINVLKFENCDKNHERFLIRNFYKSEENLNYEKQEKRHKI